MKAILYNPEQCFTLNRNSATVGNSDCDIILDDPRVDSCHAILEFNEEKQCFLIRDLDTHNGTFVNDCKLQNTPVYLANGDIIKFGNGNKNFELRFNESENATLFKPQINMQRSPVTVHANERSYMSSSSLGDNNLLPNIKRKHQKQHKITMLPHPPSRPHSANAAYPNTSFSPDNYRHARNAWNGTFDPVAQHKQNFTTDFIEQDSQRKDAVINGLRDEISNLYQMNNTNQMSSTNHLTSKLSMLERDLDERRAEIVLLRQQLDAALSSSPTLTSQLANKEKSIHELRHDLDKTKQEFSMSQSLIQSLQHELITNQNNLKKREIEHNKLKQTAKDKDIQFQSLANKFTRLHDNKLKDQALDAVNDEVKTLKTKIRRLETRSGDHSSLVQRYKTETSQLNEVIKRQELEKAQWEKQKLEQKHKLLEIQRCERLLRVDLEQLKSKSDRFRVNLSNVLYTATGLKTPEYPAHAQEGKILGDVEGLIATQKKEKDELNDVKSKHQSMETKMQEVNGSAELLETTMKEIIESLNENGHHTQLLKNKKELVNSLTVADELQALQKTFSELLQCELMWNVDLYQALEGAGYNIAVAEKRPSYFIHCLHEQYKDKEVRVSELEKEIEEIKANQSSELQQMKQSMENNATETMAIEIQRIQDEEKAKRENDIEETKRIINEQHNADMEQQTLKLIETQQQLSDANQQLSDKVTELEDNLTKLNDTANDLENSKAEIVQLREELKTVLLQNKNEIGNLSDDRVLLKSQFDKDTKQYKEEIKQHSITIVAMEERLQAVMKQLQNAQEEVKKLQRESREDKQEIHAPSAPPLINIDAYEQTISMLRSELVASQTQFHMQQDEMVMLRRELASTMARMSDLKGELSEPQKEELEHSRRKIMEQEINIGNLQQKMLKMTELVSRQQDELKKMKNEKRKDTVVSSSHSAQREIEHEEILPKKSDLLIETKETGTQEDQGGKINAELTSQGAVCRGERHESVIQRQREALVELRSRIKALENAQPIVPNHEDLAQQVILLKKELSEIRAKQTMEDDIYFRDQLTFNHENKIQSRPIASTSARGKNMEADVERNARLQMEEAIASSEQSYLDLANTVGGLLRINALVGMKPMAHVPTDERLKVTDARREDLDAISTQVKSVLNRLERKDNLLQSYEKDLAKLREAEEIAAKKSSKVTVLIDEITQKTEENSHLREALRRSEEQFSKEKRLNEAIKQKKTFYLENLDHRDMLPRHDACINGEGGKTEKSKKRFKSNLMKKEYEIQLLKQKLQEQERELCRSAARVAINQPPPRQYIKKSCSETSSLSSKKSASGRELDFE